MKYTLFLFPYAGGSSYSFNSLIPLLEPYFDVKAVEYPGRGTCFGEELVSDIKSLTELVFLNLKDDLRKPYAFWGHSMGALVCYLLTKKLQDMGYKVPEHLFLSGSRGPQFPITSSSHTLPYEAFWKVIQDLGGCPDEVLHSEELKELFEPILRSDFKCMETYRHMAGKHLSVPITLLLGREDAVSESEAKLWGAETFGPVELHLFEGDHFFIFEQGQSVVDLIIKKIKCLLAVCYIKNQSAWSPVENLQYLALLPMAEQDKCVRYTNWQDKQAYILGRLLLRYLLEQIEGKSALDALKYDAFGKPYLEHGPSFNLSHSGLYVVGAIASSAFVGVDIEECCPDVDDDLFESICTSKEWALARSQGLPSSLFYNIWTKKEAVLKANGKGLSIPLHQLEAIGDTSVLEGKTWYLKELLIASGYSCHLACDDPFVGSVNLEVLSMDDLLMR